jgi:hypothetical protein
MKIRREMVGPRAFLCPSCKAPISIEFTNPDSAAANQPKKNTSWKGRYGQLPTSKPKDVLPKPEPETKPEPENKPAPEAKPAPEPKPAPAEGTVVLPPSRVVEMGNSPIGQYNPYANTSTDRRLNTAGMNTLDADFKSKLRTIDKVEPSEPKRSSRRQKGRLADWDSKLDTVPEAEQTDDEWPDRPTTDHSDSDHERYVTKVDIVDGQQVERIRRVERRKKLNGWGRVYSVIERMGWYTIGGILAVLISGGSWMLYKVSRQKTSSGATSLSEMSTRVKDDRVAQIGQLSKDDADAAVKVTQKFYEAANWTERITFCRRPDETRKKMENWYAQRPDSALTFYGLVDYNGASAVKKTFVKDSGVFLFLSVSVGPEKRTRYVAVEQIPGKTGEPAQYLVDWEVTTQYQPMDIYDYKAKQPKDPLDFRVLAKPTGDSGYYNHSFNDKKEWAAYDLSYPGDPDFTLVGYVKRTSPLFTELEDQLNYKEANVILRLRYPENAKERDQVMIEKIILPSWYFPRKDAIAGFQ